MDDWIDGILEVVVESRFIMFGSMNLRVAFVAAI
jgi:hypothetical protein